MRSYRSVERQAVRMRQMMCRLGVDPGALIRLRYGEAYAEAHARCLACVSIGECLRWLDGYVLDGESPNFCPNLQLFRSLQGKAQRLSAREVAVEPGTNGRVPETSTARLPEGTALGSN